jgi:hypothetical protein
MDNPWLKLSLDEPEYVLDMDKGCIRNHNRLANNETRFEPKSIPEPFIGNPTTARVVFLGKNPGHREGAEEEYKQNRELVEAMFLNLRHGLLDFPFYPLKPNFAETGAGKWWALRTRELQRAMGGNLKKLAERIMVIEWFPYHSIRFAAPKEECASRAYSYELLRKMLDRGALVIGMRARKLWTGRRIDDRLASVQFLRNPQCSYLSPGNTEPGVFDQIVARIQG